MTVIGEDFAVSPFMTRIFLLLLFLIPLLCAAEPVSGFRRAVPGYQFSFPRDHGSHPDFRTEWWYFTGNVLAKDGREFGYELTIFRNAMGTPGQDASIFSPLLAKQVFLGHFAISDIAAKKHQSWERIGREGFGQASASTEKLDVKLGDWQVVMQDDGRIAVKAAKADHALDLVLTPAKPFVMHGKDGVHQKSEKVGQASHYISFTRLDTAGTITVGGEPITVEGLSWMDQEFGSDQLGGEEVGWDWFALQLDTGEDLMVYQLRRADGTVNRFSSGSLVDAKGQRTELPGDTYTIRSTGKWKSPHSKAEYPMGWVISVPGKEGELVITPRFEDQEMLTVRYTGTVYWEGAIAVSGTWRGKPVAGKGYVELVGYAGRMDRL